MIQPLSHIIFLGLSTETAKVIKTTLCFFLAKILNNNIVVNELKFVIVMWCVQILCNASSDDHIPMFHNLFSLKFYGCLYFEWHTIRLLLGQAPKLQILAFESCPNQSYDGPAPDGCWEDPRDVPECLSLHLTTCHCKGFLGDEDEMHLVRQILKEARVLKTMKIIVNSRLEPKVKLCVRKALSKIVRKFPTSSQTCQIAFDERPLL